MPKSILSASAKFLVKSGTLVLTDPRCGSPVVIENVKNGHWEASIDMREDDPSRVEDIFACHSSAGPNDKDVLEDLVVAIDTATLAICDAAYYRAQTDEECDTEPNDLEETADPFGSFYNGRGVVTETGYGDGLYCAVIARNKGKAISVYVNFDKFTETDDSAATVPTVDASLAN